MATKDEDIVAMATKDEDIVAMVTKDEDIVAMATKDEDIVAMATKEEDYRPNPMLFGRRLADIPCYRSTFLTSTCSGLGSTMAYFLFTSNMRKAINVGMVAFTGVTITYWCYCRYNYSYQKFHYARLQEAMKRYHLKDMDDRDR